MLPTGDTIRWLITAAVLYLFGYELAGQAAFLVRRAGTQPGHDRGAARVCCREVQGYMWVSAGMALVAALMGVISIPFVEAAMWSMGVWLLATLYVLARVMTVLSVAGHRK